MKKQQKKLSKGFTLIELLVVIAIIGILSTIVLVSLNTARTKARDARRISDVHQIQLALQMYYDSAGVYPAALSGLAPTYINATPLDPDGTSAYQYNVCSSGTLGYHLGTKSGGLETTNSATAADADATTTTCPGTGAFSGTDPVYDVTP